MSHPRWLLAAMFGSVLLVALVMFLDEQREFDSALSALTEEQLELVTAVGADFANRLRRIDDEREPRLTAGDVRSLVPKLLGGAIELTHRSRIFLVAPPEGPELVTSHGKLVRSPALRAALDAGADSVTLSREASRALGLPHRIAVAAIRRVGAHPANWSIVAVASAERLRARERHAQLRFLLGLLVVTLLVTGFGGLALRDQRQKLVVARELEIAALQRDRERLLAKADKMATLAALSSGIAHQIATPLSTIVARVEQVLPAVASMPKATAALTVVADQVGRIQRIITGVLSLARGNQPTLVKAAPEAIVEAALSLVGHRLAEAGVRVQRDIAADLAPIACDPPMLEQALVNLLLNASDASGRGATVRVSLRSADGVLRFVVDDEGVGISDETKARAMEPFFTTKGEQRGTGLGLVIAHEVAANHGGKLSLGRRQDERGTRAVIELPAS